MDVCKVFNSATENYVQGVPVQSKVTAYIDRSFTLTTKTPQAGWLILQCAGLEKGLSETDPRKDLSFKHIYEIAKIKQTDEHLKHLDLEQLTRMIIGTAKYMRFNIVRE